MFEGVGVSVGVSVGVTVGVGVAQKKVVTGVRLFVLLALPSSPYVLSPQHWMVHESIYAHANTGDMETSSAPVIELTETACQRSVVVPSPICPSALKPQHFTDPSLATIAQVPEPVVDSPS